MAQQVRFTTDRTITYVANGRKKESLDRGLVLRELYLNLDVTVGVASGGTTTAAANIAPGGIWGCVKKIDVIINNNDTIHTFTGEQLAHLNREYYGAAPEQETGIIGIAADATAVLSSTLILPFWLPRSAKPLDTALDARLLSDVSVQVEWGTAADVGTATGFEFSVNPQITVHTLSSFNFDGPFNTVRTFSLVDETVGINSKHRMQLPVNNTYRAFLINVKDADGHDAAITEPNGPIGNVKLKSGTVDFVDMPFNLIGRAFNQRQGLKQVLTTTGGGLHPEFVSGETRTESWRYLDLVTDGFLSEAINTEGFSSLELEFDVTAAIGKLTVIPIEIIPLRK